MTANEIVEKVTELLRGYVHLDANLHQEPYKSDFFNLCRETQREGYHHITSSPRLTADGLRDAVAANWSPHEDRKKLEVLKELCRMWQEWLYALDRV